MPRIRGPYEQIGYIRAKGIHVLARNYYINPIKYIENIMNNSFDNPVPQSYLEISEKFSLVNAEKFD